MAEQRAYVELKVKHIGKWTQERFDNAKPNVVERTDPSVLADPNRPVFNPPKGQPFDYPPKLPPDYKPQEKYFGSIVEKPQVYPLSCVGKIYLKNNYGEDKFGSASVIAQDTIVTAAHNIYAKATRTFNNSFVFLPGNTPNGSLGVFEASYAYIEDRFKDYPVMETYDIAVLRLKPGEQGYPNAGKYVAEATGGYLGFKTDLPLETCTWAEIGYPTGAHDKANVMWADEGQVFVVNDHYQEGIGKKRQHKNIDYSGISGGPWLLGPYYRQMNGIHSTTDSITHTSHSCYFTDWTAEFINDHIH